MRGAPLRSADTSRPGGRVETREQTLARVLATERQGEIISRQGADLSQDPSTRGGLQGVVARRAALGAVAGAIAGAALGVALVLTASVGALVTAGVAVAVAAVGAVIGSVLAALLSAEREDGRIERQVAEDLRRTTGP